LSKKNLKLILTKKVKQQKSERQRLRKRTNSRGNGEPGTGKDTDV